MPAQRDRNGRFIKGNTVASQGGKARAKQLPAYKRREIAQSGWQAMVNKHFNGDQQKAVAWLTARGQFKADRELFKGHNGRFI